MAPSVKTGMIFAILGESPLEVRDPVSNEVLGEVDREKVRVEAFEVRERIALCRTYEVVRRVGGLFDSGLSDLIGPRRDIVATLRSDDYARPLSGQESYVKIGDRARQVKAPARVLHPAS